MFFRQAETVWLQSLHSTSCARNCAEDCACLNVVHIGLLERTMPICLFVDIQSSFNDDKAHNALRFLLIWMRIVYQKPVDHL